jgi:hypothetical protein
MLLAVIVAAFRQTSDVAARLPVVTMPIISGSVVVGGAVAALLVVSKYSIRRATSAKELLARRTVVFFTTAVPGVIIAQLVHDLCIRQWPLLKEIGAFPPAVGLVMGGVGLPLVLSLYRRLPGVLENKAFGYLGAESPAINPAAPPTTNSIAPVEGEE